MSSPDDALILPSLPSLPERWRADLALSVSAGQLAPATASTYRVGVERFLSWGAAREVVDHLAILDWMTDLRAVYSPSTVNTWLHGVKAFFSWALARHLIAADPTKGVRGVKSRISGHKRDALSDLEIRRLLALPLNPRDRAILHVLAFSACRGAELVSADLEDLHYSEHVSIRVQGKGSQEKGELIILASLEAQDALAEWLQTRGGAPGALFYSLSPRSRGARLSLRGLHGIVKAAYRKAGIVGRLKTTHSLRHSAITAAIRGGAAIPDVQAMARHRSASTTMNYYHHQRRAENPAEGLISYGLKPQDNHGVVP